jgi:hypothetical protein
MRMQEVQVVYGAGVMGEAPVTRIGAVNVDEVVMVVQRVRDSQVINIRFKNGESLDVLGSPRDFLPSMEEE